MSTIREKYTPVEKACTACSICGRSHYCMIANDGVGVICTKIESDRKWGQAGWYHGPTRGSDTNFISGSLVDVAGDMSADFTHRLAQYGAEPKQADDEYLCWLAESLKVSSQSLARLGFGYRNNAPAWSGFSPFDTIFTVPMRHGGNTAKVIGIQTRSPTGLKRTVLGSNLGLFIPTGISFKKVYIVEGASDTAAGLDLGLPIVGRASATHGLDLLTYFVAMHRIQSVVVVADNDPDNVGLDGALKLRRELRRLCPAIVITPPPGIKDLRQWVTAGCTLRDVHALETNR